MDLPGLAGRNTIAVRPVKPILIEFELSQTNFNKFIRSVFTMAGSLILLVHGNLMRYQFLHEPIELNRCYLWLLLVFWDGPIPLNI